MDFADDEPYAVEALLIYLYTLEYPSSMLRIERPKEAWQERLALYRIAHRLRLDFFAETSLELMVSGMDSALEGTNAREFIRELYGLDQEEARILQETVVTRIVERGPDVVPQQQLDSVLLSHPLFGCDLVKAFRKKDENWKQKIAQMQRVIDRQGNTRYF